MEGFPGSDRERLLSNGNFVSGLFCPDRSPALGDEPGDGASGGGFSARPCRNFDDVAVLSLVEILDDPEVEADASFSSSGRS